MMRIILLPVLLFSCLTGYSFPPAGYQPGNASYAFRENKGQVTDQHGVFRRDIDFQLLSPGMSVFIGNGQLHYQFNSITNLAAVQQNNAIAKKNPKGVVSPQFHSYRADMELVGAHLATGIITEELQPGEDHFYLAGTKKTVTAGSYKRITYKNVYPGIDWVLYMTDHTLKYDFVVRAGGHVSDIKLHYSGATALTALPGGRVQVRTPAGTITEGIPYCYMKATGKQVASAYEIRKDTVCFKVDKQEGTLVIDPVVDWATYYGGTNDYEMTYSRISCDNTGNVYLTSTTSSIGNIATTGSHQADFGGNYDAFVVKLNKQGVRQWATYFGGSELESMTGGITCSPAGDVYIAGYADVYDPLAASIATAGSHQPAFGGGGDAFLVKLDGAGHFKWATYFGGTALDFGTAITCDSMNNVYLAGYTESAGQIALPGSLQSGYAGGVDAFIAKFSEAGVVQWSTYFGGTASDYPNGIACDKNNNVYLAGVTMSPDGIAAAGSYQPALSGSSDAFLLKLNETGARQWSTYYGGETGDCCEDARAVAVDTSGAVYITGFAQSAQGFGTAGAFQATLSSIYSDAFIAKFNTAGARQWGTYYGSTGAEQGYGIACDRAGHVYVALTTGSSLNPLSELILTTTNGYQLHYGGGNTDVVLARFTTEGKREWSSYFGGSGDEDYPAVTCDVNNVVYLVGATSSTDGIATAGSTQPALAGGVNSFLIKFNDCFALPAPAAINGSIEICSGSTQTYAVPAFSCASSYKWQLPAGWSGSSTTGSITVTAGTTSGAISVTANGLYDTSTAKTLPVIVNPLPVVAVTANGVNLNATSGFSDYQWLLNNQFITGAKAITYIAAASGNYAVIATDVKNCKDTSDLYILKLNTNLFVPNMFSPNGDSNNDLLKVYGNQLATLDFMVFNQWGQKVYESHDVNVAWDGRSGGQPQPVGVYMYTLKVVLISGEVIHKKGAVSLIR